MTDTTKKIEKLKKAGFFPDTMLTCVLVLECLDAGDLATLDILDDANSSKRMLLLYYDLIRRELIETAPENMLALYKITEKGKKFLASLYEEEHKEGVEEWIDNWIEIWPKGVTTGGKLVRSDAKTCLTKLKKFMKDYKYDQSVILEATRKYVDSFEPTGYAYIKAATYFIEKRGEGSELASWCEKVLNTETEEVYSSIDNGLI